MLWKYAEYSDSAKPLKAERIKKIEQWWQDFAAFAVPWQESADTIELVKWMTAKLPDIDDRIQWEYFPRGAINGVALHGLSLTPESERYLKPMVDGMVQQAPGISGWKFAPYRLPHPVTHMINLTKDRTGQDLSKVKIIPSRADDNRIDLRFKGTKSTEACFRLTEGILGEENLDHWVGCIDRDEGLLGKAFRAVFRVSDPNAEGTGCTPEDFKSSFESQKNIIIEGLSQQPFWEREDGAVGDASVYDCTKGTTLGMPGRQDTLVGSGVYPAPLITGLMTGNFSSCRVSKLGETFCYLKLSGWEELSKSPTERAMIADPLHDILRAQRVGRTIGGACGPTHAYIDIVVNDVDKAIAIIREHLRGFHVGKDSWLLFCDSELKGEWVGAFPDSPAPPHVQN